MLVCPAVQNRWHQDATLASNMTVVHAAYAKVGVPKEKQNSINFHSCKMHQAQVLMLAYVKHAMLLQSKPADIEEDVGRSMFV